MIDVREIDEWRAGRIAGARHVPTADVDASQSELDPSRSIVTACRTG
ncbi:MAG: rhodanese-like domain-containing protein [Acidimicrobiales bacterium]